MDSTDAYGDSHPNPRTGSKLLAPEAILDIQSYKFNYVNSGSCLIFNNKFFDKITGQSTRDGTDVDADKLEKTFMRLGFAVNRYDNYTRLQMDMALKQAGNADHSSSDCFVCIVLSHGEGDYVFAYDGRVSVSSLLNTVKGDNCPSLVGKPKLFFLQACRGTKFDAGAVANLDQTDSKPSGSPLSRMLPTEADILIAYSVVPGHFSWRNNVDGSWFIQALCRVFDNLCTPTNKISLNQMMTIVTRIVAFDYESCTNEEYTDHMRQMPCLLSMLTKEVYFKPTY